jgi:hypothetical protein
MCTWFWAEDATSNFRVQATVLNLEAVCSSKREQSPTKLHGVVNKKKHFSFGAVKGSHKECPILAKSPRQKRRVCTFNWNFWGKIFDKESRGLKF